jgi:hypothetical protein
MYDFSPDAVLVVLASEAYKEEDYIRNYDDFLKFIEEEERNKKAKSRNKGGVPCLTI